MDRPRTHDSQARARKLNHDPECRSCERRASDAHHLLYRSPGTTASGDDVEANLIPLCHHCHMIIHHVGGEQAREVREAIGANLEPDEVAYVLDRLGREAGLGYLQRTYHYKGE